MNSLETMLIRDQVPHQDECGAHGAYESRNLFRSIWSGCPQCAIDREAEEKIERGHKEKAERLGNWQRKLGTAGIPERFRDRSLESFVAETEAQRQALDFALNYAAHFDEALETGCSALFIGKPGTGKTHLAVGIGLHLMNRDSRTVLFSTVIRALRRVKDTWSKGSKEKEAEAIASLTSPDLLILDEVGVQFGSETEKFILFDSNLDLGGVRTYLGERVFDRLREDGGEVVVFDWQSYRGRV
ncbi:MAG: ATP-binding protein [Proteobacteria bacterium]|nr:ATP-binding protein [Pseudomonadota bacterium]